MTFDQQDFFNSPASPNDLPLSNDALLSLQVEGTEIFTTPVFEAYWRFAAERQRVFYRRLSGVNEPQMTDDHIIGSYRFTNTYRASDRVSQFLIQNVISSDGANDSKELFFRIILFKLFNKIETWQAIEKELGSISWERYDFMALDSLLTDRKANGDRNYSAAYIMPSAGSRFGHKSKHANHLRLIEWMINEEYPQRIGRCRNMTEAFNLLLVAPSIGPFLAYQLATDLNYSSLVSFSEMEFVKAGPGALDGIAKCFLNTGAVSPEAIIEHMALNQHHYFMHFEIEFPDLWGRPLQLIDCQNLFCEISKYSRVAFPEIKGSSGRSRIKQKFASAGRLPVPFYPPDWGLNDKVGAELRAI